MRRAILSLTVLAGLMSAAGAGAAVKPKTYGVYEGTSAQGIGVRLGGASKGGVRVFRYRAQMTCNDGSSFVDDYFSDAVTIKRSRFAASHSSSGGAVTTKVAGTLSGAHASGTLRIIERFSEVQDPSGATPLAANGSIVCDSGTVKWTATA